MLWQNSWSIIGRQFAKYTVNKIAVYWLGLHPIETLLRDQVRTTSATCTLSLSDIVCGMQKWECSYCEKCYVSATHRSPASWGNALWKGMLGYCSDCDKDFGLWFLPQQHKCSHAGGGLLTKAPCVTSILLVYHIYSSIKTAFKSLERSRISVVIVLNVLVISQTYYDMKGCTLRKNLLIVQSDVACVLVSHGIWTSTRKHALTRVQTVLINIKPQYGHCSWKAIQMYRMQQSINQF